ncbi:MAG: histidine--tRNA ligase [Thermoplasmatales archaeon]|nr:histidine--tRNA ligase [Candidatus Thermoplasmatota archaeon]MDA8056060.1 histidine--tRNA ligase [Thermoplasmatales archaeon]
MVERLRGFRDFYPEEQEVRSEIFKTMRESCRQFGFREIGAPSVESVELFANKSGMEIMNQMFSFRDKGGRDITLVPEFTPTLSRMVAARKDLVKPLKWFSIEKFWRYEEPQSGRLREFYQLNADILGSDSYLADAEIISLGGYILKNLGIGEFSRLKVSSRILIDRLIEKFLPGKREEVYYILDRWSKISQEERENFLSQKGLDRDIIFSFTNGSILSGLDDPELQKLTKILDYVKSSVEVDIEIDLKIVRGIAYYTGCVFEASDREEKSRSILGGGRYDNVIAQLGGENTPATGFAMGDAVLENILKAKGLWAKKRERLVFVAPIDLPGRSFSVRVTTALRSLGFRVDLNVMERGISKQLDYASKMGYQYAIILGENEAKKESVSVKNMSNGQQTEVELKNISELLDIIK